MNTPQAHLQPRKILIGGLCFLPLGWVAGLLVLLLAEGASSYRLLPLWCTLSAFLTGCVLWWLVVVRRSMYTREAGRMAGLLTTIAIHGSGSASCDEIVDVFAKGSKALASEEVALLAEIPPSMATALGRLWRPSGSGAIESPTAATRRQSSW